MPLGLGLLRLYFRLIRQSGYSERGLATVSIALLSFFAAATMATTVTLSQTDVNFDALESLVEDSVGRVGASLEVRGSVVVFTDEAGEVESIRVPVAVFGEGKPVPLAEGEPERLLIAYTDSAIYDPKVEYSYELLSGDGDDYLENGEMALLIIEASAIGIEGETPHLAGNERFTLEMASPVGGTIILSRRLPAILQPVMALP